MPGLAHAEDRGWRLIIDDYYDIMMLCPVSLGLTTPEQVEGVKTKLQYFRDSPRYWLEWPFAPTG